MNNQDKNYFYEGEIVPDLMKQSLYRLENKKTPVGDKSIFMNIFAAMIQDLMTKKNIRLSNVNLYVNSKVKKINTYVLQFEDNDSNKFYSSFINEKGGLPFDTTKILSCSILFTFAEYGCKFCNYASKDCEYCSRDKISKIFPPETKYTLKDNMENFVKVFGKETIASIKDFCDGYCEYMRSPDEEDEGEIKNDYDTSTIPEELQRYMEIDANLIAYVSQMTYAMFRQYANGDKDMQRSLSNYNNVEKSLVAITSHLEKLKDFVKAVKTDPARFIEDFNDEFDDGDDGDDWQEDEDEDEDEDEEGA